MSNRTLPESIQGLNKVAHNYWWSWNYDAIELFEKLNPSVWSSTRNPVEVLHNTDDATISSFANDSAYCADVSKVESSLSAYLENQNTWFNKEHADHKGKKVVYFSAEYGIHESLPIYSGGLGVLSGDHVKSTSDLGIPGVFVGLLYKDGYFIQHINEKGQQVDKYKVHDANKLAVLPALNANGEQVEVSVDLAGKSVFAKVWKAQVGRVELFLLDSNVDKNSDIDREITARLYGGDREMRISQEIILGIGGVRALEQMGVDGAIYHMNEGHSGFFQLERIANQMKAFDLNFEEAKVVCSSNCVFTTHTPVPAGNEAFTFQVMHKYFYSYIEDLGISWDRFINLGLVDEGTDNRYFSLTVFAINFSRFQNGVSELHGRIAQKMWRGLWSNVPEIDNSIGHITNGIHVETWTCPEVKNFLTEKFGSEWKEKIADQEFWNKAYELPVGEIADVKKLRKAKMIDLVRTRLKEQLTRNGGTSNEIDEVDSFLRDDALTIGFARRFATYKRATLIFKDLEKLASIVNDEKRPVQFIFAGKAHPADIPGQQFIKEIYEISRTEEFKGKVIILENYDMNISSHLVSGVDVWLNNPRRPMEASGTSGQKVPINFGLNFSVLDGWWREGYDGNNGWTIGTEKDYPNDEVQDFEDANDFYKTLNQTIVPLYYGDQDNWFEKTKVSFVTNIARYSMSRQVMDYMNQLYSPAINYGETLRDPSFTKVRSYISQRRFLRTNWGTVSFNQPSFNGSIIAVDSRYNEFKDTPSHHVDMSVDDTLPGRVFEAESFDVTLPVYIGAMDPKNVCCEAVLTDANDLEHFVSVPLGFVESDGSGTSTYGLHYKSETGDPKRIRFRVFPTFEGLGQKFELGFAEWF
ncbi:MAG: alpha-glucan family phosphorylase [Bacteriovoracaceae bacterium]|nr:alpha-glucan family phosphorylase [Bacteriovoracaceae bacterium]